MEWVRKGDVDKVIKVTNQGLDPNFIDPDSGGSTQQHLFKPGKCN